MIKAKFSKTVFGLCWLFLLGFWVNTYAGWTEPVRISEPGGCWYPQIAVQGDTLHVVYTNSAGGDKISYVRSTDAGNTWSEHVVLSETDNSYNTFFPRIIIYNSNIIVLWKNTIDDGIYRKNIGYSISHNNGLTWDGPDYLFYPNWEHILYFAAAGNNSVINIIFNSRIEQDLRYYDIRSTNFGQTWSDTLELFRSTESGLMDMTAYNNTFHYIWYGSFDDTSYWETYYIRSTNGGNSWSENVMLTSDDDHNSYWSCVSTNEYGDAVLCWTDFKYSPSPFSGDVFIRYSYDNGSSWTDEEQITFDHLAKHSHIFWRSDTIHVVWENGNYTQRDIFYIMNNGLGWSDEYRLDNDPADSYSPRVASSNGRVYVVWADSRCDPDTNICGGVYFSRYEEDTEIIEDTDRPDEFDLVKAYPNPFNSVATLIYSNLEGGGIEIFNVSGQLVRTFHIDTGKEGKIIWDATDAKGNKVSSGIYFARARTSKNFNTIKLIYLK